MPLSTDVRLPRDATPVFPDRCVACGRERPGDVLRVAVRRAGLWDLLLPWLWFARSAVRAEAPACPPCRSAAARQRRLRGLTLIAAVAAVVPFVFPWVKAQGMSRGWTKATMLALCSVPALPWLVWVTLRPPPFDLTVGADFVDYEFADADYAAAFCTANDGEIR